MLELTSTEIIFWLLILVCLYTLKGYPLALRILLMFKSHRSDRYDDADKENAVQPLISFIIAAYNEENNIAAKIANLQEIDYPMELTEFIIGSDCSSDRTDEIIKHAAESDNRIRFFRMPDRTGKIGVVHQAVARAQGAILLFTDCSVRTNSDFMPVVMSRFAEQNIGLISSHDVWVDPVSGSPTGQSQYIEYEMKIRQMESDLSSMVSASGSFFAVRKELFRGYQDGLADDFALPLDIVRQQFRVVHCSEMIGYVPMVKTSADEIKRRTRIILAGIKTVGANMPLLFSLRQPIFAWQLWSHKVLKWLFPFFFIAVGILAINLRNDGLLYNLFAIGIGLIVIGGLLGFFIKGRSLIFKPFQICNFFLLSMIAVMNAWLKLFLGNSQTFWEPTHR